MPASTVTLAGRPFWRICTYLPPADDLTAELGTAKTSAAISVMMLSDTVMPLLTAGSIASGVITALYETTPGVVGAAVSTRVTCPDRVSRGESRK